MRASLTVTRIAALSVLLAGSAFVPPASAQKGNMLSPVSQWSVSRIEGASAGGRPYCAMARRYTKDLILTVAQNQAREASLALDFQHNSFHPQQLFSLVLDPGAGEVRKYQMRPSSENAFVVRLGNDLPFFEALKTTGFLRVGVDNKQYHFDIGDIDEGKEKLDNCIAYLDADPVYGIAAYGSGDKGWSAAASPQKYEQALAELRAHISRLQSEKQSLEGELVGKQANYESHLGVSSGDPVEAQALNNEIDLLEKENERLLLKIADAGTQAAPASGEPAKQGVPAAVENVDAQVLPEPPPLPAAREDIGKLSSDMSALQNKNKALIETIEKVRAQTQAEYDKLLAEQAKENEALKVALAAGNQPDGEKSVLKLQEAIVTLERQKEDLGAKMKVLESTNAEMNLALKGTQGDEAALRAQNAELQRALELAGAGLVAETPDAPVMPETPVALVSAPAPVKIAEPVLAITPVADEPAKVEAPMEITQTVGSQEIAKRDSDHLRMMEAKLAGLEVVNKDLQESLNQAMKRTDAYEKEIKAKEAAFLAMQEENKALRQQLAQVQSGGANAEKIAALVAENKELKDNVRRLSDDLMQIRAQLAGFENRMAPAQTQTQAAGLADAGQEVAPHVADAGQTTQAAAQNVAQVPAQVMEDAARIVEQPAKEVSSSQAAPAFNDADYASAAQKYEAELAYAINESGVAAPAPAVSSAPIAPVKDTVSAAAKAPSPAAPIETEVLHDAPVETAEAPKNMLNIGAKKAENPADELAEKERLVAQKAAAAFAGQAYHFTPDFDIQSLLNEAHVTLPEYVQKVDNAGSKTTLAYRWQSQGVFGSAELKPIVSKMQFDDFVYEYLQITQERCDGEFAVVPERTIESGALRLDSYEIACIGGRVDSTASLLFFSKDDTFTVLAQESPMEQMPLIMEARDRLIKALSNSHT